MSTHKAPFRLDVIPFFLSDMKISPASGEVHYILIRVGGDVFSCWTNFP